MDVLLFAVVLAQAEGFDITSPLASAGAVGLVFFLLVTGKWIILARELVRVQEAHKEILAEKDRQITDLKDRIEAQSAHITLQEGKLEERNLFIQKTLIDHQGQVLDRQIEIIEMQTRIDHSRDRRDAQ